MKVNTVAAEAGYGSVSLTVSMRRVVGTAGFVFGFVLLTLFMADDASASEGDGNTSDGHNVGSLLEETTASLGDDIIKPVADDVIEPVAEPVGDPVVESAAPVVKPVTETVEPVVTPVADSAKPVTEPLVGSAVGLAGPVVEAASPVVEPVAAPILRAGEPVVTPVAEAIGSEQVVSELSSQPALPEAGDSPPRDAPESGRVLDGIESTFIEIPRHETISAQGTESTEILASAERGTPRFPIGPSDNFTVGVSTSSVGSAGSSHGMDNAVFPGSSSRLDSVGDRGPPSMVDTVEWWGYSDRSHPG